MRAIAAATVLTAAALLPLQAASAAPADVTGKRAGSVQCGFCWDAGILPRCDVCSDAGFGRR